MDFPLPVAEHLRRLCVERRFPAFVQVGPDGRALAAGGSFDHFGLPEIRLDEPVGEQIDFLEGMLPLDGQAVDLPFVHTPSGSYAELHLFPGEDGDWVLILDKSTEGARLFQLQQAAHEVSLLRDKEAAMLAQIRLSHEGLLSIFNQLRLVTAIVNRDGRIEFLSEVGQQFFTKRREELVGAHWERLLQLDKADRARLRRLFELPAASREKVRLQTPVGSGGQRRWLEIDLQDDPREPSNRILYIYDVTEIHDLRQLLVEKTQFHDIIGKSKPMEQVFQLIRDVSNVDSTVLIEGETGTGKELVARAIHYTSHRKGGPFVVVNCAGLSDSLINSQLFGHMKGSFTDAVSDQEGVFEAAHGGTIFLDEIGDIPMNTQTRLLRVLEQKEIVRIGETKPRQIEIRILAATNKDLAVEVDRGNFRLDLLYRIRVARVHLPPLRQRREDIPLLLEAFLAQARAITGKRVESVESDAMRLLLDHPWPGNVRELKNAIEFGVIRCRGTSIPSADLPREILEGRMMGAARRDQAAQEERERILEALDQAKGSRGEAAKLLGISRATLYRRLKVCGLNVAGLPRG